MRPENDIAEAGLIAGEPDEGVDDVQVGAPQLRAVRVVLAEGEVELPSFPRFELELRPASSVL